MYKIIRKYLRLFIALTQQYLLYYYYKYFVFNALTGSSEEKPRVLFGPCPIINNKYWANALRSKGYKADSITSVIPSVNNNQPFDLLIEELIPIQGKRTNWSLTKQKLQLFAHILREYDIFVMAFRFNYFDNTFFYKKEAGLLHKYRKKIIIIPYGSDYYRYSKVIDHSLKHNLMIDVPAEIFNEKKIQERVDYWNAFADAVIMGIMLDDATRWDCLPVSFLCIDMSSWHQTKKRQLANGHDSEVKIVHTPNHRGFKGTEFIVKAIRELKEEGLKIDFTLIEKMPNEDVRKILTAEADILVEQIIFTGYALSGIEGLAAGLTVLSNLENKDLTDIFRRYSYLNECPIVSSSPETIKDNLRLLITQPDLRQQLGKAGRKYAEKYHSYHAFASLFSEIEKKIWKGDPSADPMKFFNPQNPLSYNTTKERVQHPLINNQIFVQ